MTMEAPPSTFDDLWDDLPERDQEAVVTPVAEGQSSLFDEAETHRVWAEWQGMPEMVMNDLQPESVIQVKFRSAEDRLRFAELIGQVVRRDELRGIWFPKLEIGSYWDKRYRDATGGTE